MLPDATLHCSRDLKISLPLFPGKNSGVTELQKGNYSHLRNRRVTVSTTTYERRWMFVGSERKINSATLRIAQRNDRH